MNSKTMQKKIDEAIGVLCRQKRLDGDTPLLRRFLDELPLCIWMHDENYTITYGNHAFEERFGCLQKKVFCYQWLMGKESICSCCVSKKTWADTQPEHCRNCKRKKNGYDLNVYHVPIISETGKTCNLKSSLHLRDLNQLLSKYLNA